MNRIRVGTEDGIDKTYVELKAKKLGRPALLIKTDDLVRLKTLDIRDTHRTRQSGCVFAPQPQFALDAGLVGASLGVRRAQY